MKKQQQSYRFTLFLVMLVIIAVVRIGLLATDVLDIVEEALCEHVVKVDILNLFF